MSLEKETVKKVEAFLGSQNLKPETASVLNQLSSGELIPESLNKNKDQVNAFERVSKSTIKSLVHNFKKYIYEKLFIY